MTEYAERYLLAGAPETIMHGKYEGQLIDIQPLVDGRVCGIYRFRSGDCIGGPAFHWSKLRQRGDAGLITEKERKNREEAKQK